MQFYEKKFRSVVKTILWRIIATIITWVVTFVYTGALRESLEITVMAALLGMTAYYFYERIWNIVQWGKINVMDKK